MKNMFILVIFLIVSVNAKAFPPELLPLVEAPVDDPNRVDKIILGIESRFNLHDPEDPVRRILVDWADGEGKLILSSIKDPELYKSVQKSIYTQLKEKNAAPKQLTQEQAVEFFDLAGAKCGLSLRKTSTPNIYDVILKQNVKDKEQQILGQVGMEETSVAELYASSKNEDNPNAPREFGYRMRQYIQPTVDHGASTIVVWHDLKNSYLRLQMLSGKPRFMHCNRAGELKANWGDVKVKF